MRTDTEALKDRLHAVLRETDDYLSTREIGERAGHAWVAFPHSPQWHTDGRFSHCLNGQCYLSVSLGTNPRVWRLLNMMEKQHLVYRAEVQGNPKAIYWAYVENFALNPMPIDELEEAWAMEAHDRG